MEIKYLGHSCFSLKGKDASVITDPFDEKMVGLKLGKLSTDIVTISHEHPDHNKREDIEGDPIIIDLPGEYEKKGIRVTGIATYHDKTKGEERGKNTIFKIEIDGVSILHCGDLGHELSDEALEELGEVHVLLVPVGGFYTIAADDAVRIIKQVEPSLVIPMHYNQEGVNPELGSKLAPVDDFLAKIGVGPQEKVKKLAVKKEELTGDMKVVVMDIS
jgi:L-ascorbate metabolism protein UlaG (beta-lactamase superfamily)